MRNGEQMSRYECPRCGSGVRPDDVQCGRCGEILRQGKTVDEPREPPKVTVQNILNQRATSVRLGDSEYVTVARMRKVLEEKERDLVQRETEIAARENELLSSLEEIESDTHVLEKTMADLDREEVALAEKERALRDREKDLQRISDSLSEWREVIGRYEELMHGEEITPQDIEKVIRMQEDFQDVLEKERDRLRLEVREEISEEMEAMALREEQFRITESTLMQKALELRNSLRDRKAVEETDQAVERPEIDLREELRETFNEIESQIGAGIDLLVEGSPIPTHIPKLDAILQGGIPRGHVILVNGMAGSMKSSFSYQILHRCAVEDGIKGMYFSLEQSRESLLRQMDRLGLDRESSRENLLVVDMVDLRKAMAGEEGDWREILTRYVQNVKTEKEFDLFVLDSLQSFKAMSEYSFSREDLAELFDWFREMGLTTLLISELPPVELLESGQGELYLADGAIQLTMKEVGDRMQRRMKIPKMRGVDVDQRTYAFSYEGGSFQLRPPLTS